MSRILQVIVAILTMLGMLSGLNVIEIVDEPIECEIITGSYEMSLDSFDGGGPMYYVDFGEEGIVEVEYSKAYYNADHELMDGAGFDWVLTFSGLQPGTTEVTVTCEAFYLDGPETIDEFVLEVDEDLTVQRIEQED